MNDRATVKKIVEELDARAGRAPEPPAGLRENLLREVPERLELAPELSEAGRSGGEWRPARWALAAAASVVLALGAGVVAVRVLEEERPAAVRESVADAPPEARAARPAEETEGASAVEGPYEPETPTTQDRAARTQQPRRPEAAASAAGGVRVRVSDLQGQPLPGARIELSGSAVPKSVFTDAEGEAKLESLPPGRYGIEAALEGFSGVEYPEVTVREDRDTALEISLAPGVEEAITVTSESPLLDASGVRQGSVARRVREAEPEPPARIVAAPLALPRPPAPPPPPMPPSTGGTSEPNDQAYGDVFFKAYGTNPFIDTEDDPLSTFALDVDTGSYGVVRRYLADGHLPPAEAVRVEELVNAFDYGDRPPARGDFALGAEGARSPFALLGRRLRRAARSATTSCGSRSVPARWPPPTASRRSSPSWSMSRARWPTTTASGWSRGPSACSSASSDRTTGSGW
jgi:hypothetical protein